MTEDAKEGGALETREVYEHPYDRPELDWRYIGDPPDA